MNNNSLRTRMRNRHSGFTFTELIVSMASAAILLAGLSGCLFMATNAFNGSAEAQKQAEVAEVQSSIRRDLQLATSFSQRTANTVTFKTPDRDGDSQEETLSYQWLSGSNELQYSLNGASSIILEDVTAFQFTYTDRFMPAASGPPDPYNTTNWGTRWAVAAEVAYEGFDEASDKAKEAVQISVPTGTVEGDLLIAAVATDGNTSSSIGPELSGWTQVAVAHNNGEVTLAVWWKNAAAVEPSKHKFEWSGNEHVYGWIMRFSSHNASNPIDNYTVLSSDSSAPTSPAVTASTGGALILRLAGFDDNDIVTDSPGLTGHTVITCDESGPGPGKCSGGAGYVVQSTAGDSGQSNFSLTDPQKAVAITIAIAPTTN